MPFVVKSHTVESAADASERIDRVVQRLCGLSRSQVTGLFDHGCVLVDGARCNQPQRRVISGEKVELRYDPARKYNPAPKPRGNLGFTIVHEDRQILVVDKPAHLLTVPTRRGETNTLADKVSTYAKHVSKAEAHTVHRLDRGVSGLLVFGKSLDISQQIRDQFAAHKPERRYLAIVAGEPPQPAGTFRSLLATDKDLNRFSTDDPEIGQLAVTHYQTQRQISGATLVSVWLETGRRNQIRVHFAEAGAPVLGDPRYESQLARHPRWPYERLALHAQRLALEHPETGELLTWESPLPIEFERFLRDPTPPPRGQRPRRGE